MRLILPAVVLALAAVAGCAATPTGATLSQSGAPAAPVPAGNSNIVQLPFGGSFNGTALQIGLSKPVAYTPSDSAFITQNTGRYLAFNLTVGDRTADQSFPAMAISVQAESGSTQDQAVEDSANNIGVSTATILPGKALTWEVAFSVPATAHDVTVQVTSTGGGKVIVFSGSI